MNAQTLTAVTFTLARTQAPLLGMQKVTSGLPSLFLLNFADLCVRRLKVHAFGRFM